MFCSQAVKPLALLSILKREAGTGNSVLVFASSVDATHRYDSSLFKRILLFTFYVRLYLLLQYMGLSSIAEYSGHLSRSEQAGILKRVREGDLEV